MRESSPTFQKSVYHMSGTTNHIVIIIPAKKLRDGKNGVNKGPTIGFREISSNKLSLDLWMGVWIQRGLPVDPITVQSKVIVNSPFVEVAESQQISSEKRV